ncbi:undecaprenyl pyrophosphate synthase [Candidatus Methanoperedens nitroreducens]|uniref:Undecaprenyl pyrophosphate synthase n=2 Tax=Candidatus Methanoperedens nitratireducens TaxID=1392998 RepID=A0A062UZH6_9EURY|nr:undecaprenyl pyrophosphate synthase [Candidatus Methanoperedens nitroreducens]MDJ1420413.1 undecaprenyl diphosphate synthase family protein [Candidatus Methanoperedens sp.]
MLRLYEWKLQNAIKNQEVPKHIVLALAESDLLADDNFNKLKSFSSWCKEMGISIVTIYISIIEVDAELSRKICLKLSEEIPSVLCEITRNINVITRWDREIKKYEDKGMRLDISLGYSGKYELTRAIKEIMKKIEDNNLNPEDINEDIIESHLLFKFEPDLVIRAGGKRLIDFLIWQAVYSELYFTDVNWLDFRKVDFLRALRDFQKRQRRFGK